MTGTCKYCGQEIMVSEDMTTEEERNEAATENCTCYGATEQEKRKRQIEKAEKNIERLFNAEPELADIMRGSVNYIQDTSVKKVSCENQFGVKATIKMTSKGAIKIQRDLHKNTAEEA